MKRNLWMTIMSLMIPPTMLLALLTGCDTGKKTDEQRILERIEIWRNDWEARNVDGIISVLPDDFYHSALGGRYQTQLLVQMLFQEGIYEDTHIAWDDVEIRVSQDGQSAAIGPVGYSRMSRSSTLMIDLVKGDDGVWYVTGGAPY